jgi:hypothetical protein
MPTSLLQEPLITPLEYLSSKPYIEVFNWIIIVPSSTFFIYFLGVQTILLGVSFLRNKPSVAQTWWGISMIFWGLGALLAGTSYQGLGYELKCVGQEYCLHTSWFELAYYYFTGISIGALGIGIAYTILPQEKRGFLFTYSNIAIVLYTFILVLGSIVENRFLVSYELFTLFFMPLFLIFFIYNIKQYNRQHDPLNKTLITTWILFLVVNLSYYVYFFLGIGESLYTNKGIWFSANDVLHVALIIWMGYLQFYVKKQIP